MGAHAPHGVCDGVRRLAGDEGMTTQVRQGRAGRVPRLGDQPDDNITVGDDATNLVMFGDHHVANRGIPHGAGGLVHGGGAGQRHRVGGHALTHRLGPRRLLLLRPAVAVVWVQPGRRHTAFLDMVPYTARRRPGVTRPVAPMRW